MAYTEELRFSIKLNADFWKYIKNLIFQKTRRTFRLDSLKGLSLQNNWGKIPNIWLNIFEPILFYAQHNFFGREINVQCSHSVRLSPIAIKDGQNSDSAFFKLKQRYKNAKTPS